MSIAILLCLHLLSVIVWIGGMAAIHHAVRPSVTVMLAPPQRLPLMAAILGRFFVLVAVAVIVLLFSGFAMIKLAGGFAAVHWTVHAMTTAGLLMMVLFGRLLFRAYPALRTAVEDEQWPQAAGQLDTIRRTVVINLVLGVAIVVLVTVGRTGALS